MPIQGRTSHERHGNADIRGGEGYREGAEGEGKRKGKRQRRDMYMDDKAFYLDV